MKRPYQIFAILFLLSSIAFSQSGTAKSLEIGNHLQRADSNTIYNHNVRNPYWQFITFDENEDTVFVYGKYRRKIEYRFKLPTMPDEHNWTIIEALEKHII